MLPDGTLPDDYVVLDLETTGVSWYRDTIIEFGAVKVVDRKPVDTYQQLVNPMRNLNPFITQLTGITPDMLEPAPTLDTVLPDFLRWCGDDAMIGHNIMRFDIKFIDLAAQRILHHAVPNPHRYVADEPEHVPAVQPTPAGRPDPAFRHRRRRGAPRAVGRRADADVLRIHARRAASQRLLRAERAD